MAEHHSSLGAAFDPLHIQDELPYTFYTRLRQEEPITFSPTINAYLVSRYDDIRSILSQPDLFSSKELTQRIPTMRLVPDQQFEYGFRFSNYGYKHIYLQWD